MKNIKKFSSHFNVWLCLMITFTIISCKEDSGIQFAREGAKPDKLTNISFEEAAGGAIISYDMPDNVDLRYVQATYTLDNGRTMVAKSSVYDNHLKVEGFAKIGEYNIELKAVSVGEVQSDPIMIKIKTGKPQYQILAESFESDSYFYSTFGGINLVYKNESAANIILRVFKFGTNPTTNMTGWNTINDTYTKSKEGVIRVRGENPIAAKYGVIIRDQWGNISDTIVRTLTPLEEVELKGIKGYKGIVAYSNENKNGEYILNYSAQGNSADLEVALFDGLQTGSTYNTGKQWWGRNAPIPLQFSLDLGKKVQLSRVKLWGRNDNASLLFQATHPKEFEVYASNNPATDGSWDSWTLVGSFTGTRPSGLAFGVNATQEDQTYAQAGEDFEVAWDTQESYRYFRVKVLCTWNGVREQPLGNALTVAISEMKFFGKYTQ
ncbi:DUF5000 domain-containing lipoprotein [Sphingobacterium anhuiense]|uniref:DUF5000 domain-containing lipoprotein n=1 Tax=Sphingobacterium anhuiense TaxID=493780 RepID=A0ABW5YU40_9SPHI